MAKAVKNEARETENYREEIQSLLEKAEVFEKFVSLTLAVILVLTSGGTFTKRLRLPAGV